MENNKNIQTNIAIISKTINKYINTNLCMCMKNITTNNYFFFFFAVFNLQLFSVFIAKLRKKDLNIAEYIPSTTA